jgi:hypothetical protein
LIGFELKSHWSLVNPGQSLYTIFFPNHSEVMIMRVKLFRRGRLVGLVNQRFHKVLHDEHYERDSLSIKLDIPWMKP